MREINSENNNLFRKLMALGGAHEFKKTQRIIIEGLRQIEEALHANAALEYLVFSDDRKGEMLLKRLQETSVELLDGLDPDQLLCMRKDLFLRLSFTETPQGVLAILQPQRKTLIDLEQRDSLILIDVQDPGNVGTLIRSADAFDIGQVVILGATASPWLEKTLRAAMGSTFHLNVIEERDILLALTELKKLNIELLAMDISGQDIRRLGREMEYFGLMMGNEGSGLTREVMDESDQVIRIEMPGQAESLNVAMAGAIALYELKR